MNHRECINRSGRRLMALAGLLVLVGAGFLPGEVQAQSVNCTSLRPPNEVFDNGADADADGFTDVQECNGILTLAQTGGVARTFPWCGEANADGVLPPRNLCLDPNSKDLFAIVRLPASGSLLPSVDFNPFLPFAAYGINFIGLNALGVAVHKLSPLEAAADRTVALAVGVPGVPAPKAVMVTESLDVNGTILGNCQYGLPSGLDGCVIYTQRTQNFIASKCGSASVQTPGGAASTAQQVLWAYATYLFLHETGHSLGGLTFEYNSRFGGYHYKPGAGLVMEQAVTYTVKNNVCKFFISPNWNLASDPQNVRLK